MTISVDCRMIESSGVGAYLKGILPFFLKTQHSFLLVGNKQRLAQYGVPVLDCSLKPFSIKETLLFSASIAKKINQTDIYFSPFFNIPSKIKIPVFCTIHDIVFPDMPELTSKIGLAVRMQFFKRAYKISKKIFTVSEFSKSRIQHHLGSNKPIIVTHSAIQPIFLEYRKNNLIINKQETIIFIGNIKKHKGLDILLESFSLAKEQGISHKLIIIGSKDNFRSKDNTIIKKINSLGNSVEFTGLIPDKKLIEYVASASLLVQPSLYEGFCLPPLEAQVLGTPVLISDIPVLKEIYADYPVTFFRCGDVIDLKDKIISLLKVNASLPALKDELLFKYTFDKTAKKILNALEN